MTTEYRTVDNRLPEEERDRFPRATPERMPAAADPPEHAARAQGRGRFLPGDGWGR